MDPQLVALRDRINIVVEHLPYLEREAISLEDSCPICLVSFDSILDNPPFAGQDEIEHHGVTKLMDCGHIFCRKDLVQWINNMHGTCPTCRHPFLDIQPPSESDDESSDGGEYLPDQLDMDAFTDADDFDPEEYERELQLMALDEDEDSDDSAYMNLYRSFSEEGVTDSDSLLDEEDYESDEDDSLMTTDSGEGNNVPEVNSGFDDEDLLMEPNDQEGTK